MIRACKGIGTRVSSTSVLHLLQPCRRIQGGHSQLPCVIWPASLISPVLWASSRAQSQLAMPAGMSALPPHGHSANSTDRVFRTLPSGHAAHSQAATYADVVQGVQDRISERDIYEDNCQVATVPVWRLRDPVWRLLIHKNHVLSDVTTTHL